MRQRIITVFFLILILGTFIGWLFGVESVTRENRKMAEAPTVSVRNLIDSKFYSQLNDFFNDHSPWRGRLIKTKNWIDYSVFNTSPSDKVVLGKDGWLYYASTMKDYFKDSCDDRFKVRVLARKLYSLERIIESLGKKFIFVIAPNKSTIYPEHVEFKRPANSCGKSFYDILLEAFKEYPIKGFVRLDDLLIKAKQESPVYHVRDTHWNATGATIVSEAILKKISPDKWKSYYPDIEFENSSRNSDLSNTLDMLFVDLREEVVAIKNIAYVSTIIEEQREPLQNRQLRPGYSAEPLPGRRLLPKTLIYRDSFMREPLKIIKGSFKRIDALWSSSILISKKVDYEDFMTSKIIIFEVAERDLWRVRINMK